MTIAGMVLVNNPGTWSVIYGPLKHAEWHGITPTDYIFPFFLFIVGVAVPMSLGKKLASGIDRSVYTRIFSRSAAIFASGLVMSAIPFFIINETAIPWPLKWTAVASVIAGLYFLYLRNFKLAFALIGIWAAVVIAAFLIGWQVTPYNLGTMRIPGVLQRIAVCYLVVALIFLHTSWKQQAAIGVGLLLFYWLLMTRIAVPGCEVTTIDDKACNLAAYLDRLILTENHIWRAGKVFDPEGILSTLPAIATTISGVLTGTWLMKSDKGRGTRDEGRAAEVGDAESGSEHIPASARLDVSASSANSTAIDKALGLFVFGTILLAVGWAWSLVFPLNKSLWTSSYVIYTSGLALLTLGFCYFLIDIKGYKRWAKPFIVFGVNALALFVFSGIMARILGIIRVAGPEGKEITLQQWLYQNLFLSWLEPVNASLAYAVAFILFWLFLMWLLYRRRIFIKL